MNNSTQLNEQQIAKLKDGACRGEQEVPIPSPWTWSEFWRVILEIVESVQPDLCVQSGTFNRQHRGMTPDCGFPFVPAESKPTTRQVIYEHARPRRRTIGRGWEGWGWLRLMTSYSGQHGAPSPAGF